MALPWILAVSSLLLTFLRSPVQGYSTGPPNQACDEMKPLHGVPPKETTFPYSIETSSRTYCDNSIILVTINGNVDGSVNNFKGFFCQARTQVDTYETTGTLKGFDESTKPTKNNCGQKAALSHANSNPVPSVRFTWQPDQSETRDVTFVCTVVQNRISFWVKQQSPKLSYDPNNCPPAGLPTLCANNQFCNASVMFSICNTAADADGECVCPSDRKLVNPIDTSCSPKGLGDSCTGAADCKYITGTAACNSASRCACATGFVVKPNQNECVPETVTDVTCNSDGDCARYQFATCDLQKRKCQCTENVKEDNGQCALKALGDECSKDSECPVVDSFCDATCKCKPSYMQQNGLCEKDPTSCAADPCKNDANSFCSLGNCLCKPAYKKNQVGDCVPKGLDDRCGETSECADATNSICDMASKTCKCRPLYIRQGVNCVPDTTICASDTCNGVLNSECILGKCVCFSAYKKDNTGQCIRKGLGDNCTQIEDCAAVDQSVCDSGITKKCICSALYMAQENKCVLKDTGDVCNADTCKGVLNSRCYPNSIECVCLSAYKNKSNTCVPKGLSDDCGINDDCKGVTNTVCERSICACSSSYKPDGDGRCIWKGLGDPCSTTENCRGVPNSICNATRLCDCPSSYKKLNNLVCELKGLSDSCTRDEDCGGFQNLTCDSNSRCACSNTYKPVNRQCIIKGISDPCTATDDCRGVPNAVCMSDKCACPSAYKRANGTCRIRGLGEMCSDNSNCGLPMSICDSNKECKCAPGYMEQSNRCVVDAFDIACANDGDCTAISMAVCDTLKTQKCICPVGYMRDDSRCVERVLGDGCLLDRDCNGVPMAICDAANKCACPQWYKQRSTRQCEIKVLNDSCIYNDDCRSVPNALCDKDNTRRCKCMTAYKEERNQTHKYCSIREIGDTCANSAECAGIENSNCDEGNTDTCVCPPGRKVVSYGCVSKVLGKKCSLVNNCKGVSSAICMDDECTCSYGYDKNIITDTCDSNGRISGVSSNTVISSSTVLVGLVLQVLLCRLEFS